MAAGPSPAAVGELKARENDQRLRDEVVTRDLSVNIDLDKSRSLTLVRLLLERGADVNSPAGDFHGRTALQAAVEWDHQDAVRCLLDAGANVNAPSCTMGGSTAIQAAVGTGNMELIDKLVAAGADINAAAGLCGGRTCLQVAAEMGNIEAISYLLERGADVNAPAAGIYGLTALQAAVVTDNLAIGNILLDHGADVNGLPSETRGHTALSAAVKVANLNLVQMLLERGADPNQYNPSTNPLLLAIESRLDNVLQCLLEAGADPNGTYVPQTNQTPIECATVKPRAHIISKLIRYGAYLGGPCGASSLRNAIATTTPREIIELLLANGAKPDFSTGKYPPSSRVSVFQCGLAWKLYDICWLIYRLQYRLTRPHCAAQSRRGEKNGSSVSASAGRSRCE